MTTRRYHVPDGHPRQCQFPGCDWVRTSINPPYCSNHLGKYRRGTLDRDSEAARHEDDPWWIPEDGEFDEIAVSIATLGHRLVRLTTSERLEATRRILAGGGDLGDIMQNLGVKKGLAWRLFGQVRNKDAA